MQEYLHQTADAGDTLSESGCRSHSIRKRMQESLYQTADAGDTLSDSGCMKLSDGESLPHPLSDGESPASAVL